MCEENADYVRRMSDEIVGCVSSRPEQRPRSPRRYPISHVARRQSPQQRSRSDGFPDGFSGRASDVQHLSRLTPPEGCTTFAEVAWAYENYANGMGAAGRRSTLCFAQDSIVPDNLQSIARKSAPLRSPRRRPNSAGSTPRQSTSSLHSSPSRPRSRSCSPRQLARTPSREHRLRHAFSPISAPPILTSPTQRKGQFMSLINGPLAAEPDADKSEVAWFTPERQSRAVLSPESIEKQARSSHSPGHNSAGMRVHRSSGADGLLEKIPDRSSKLAVDFSVYRSQCGTHGQTLANCGMVRRSTNDQLSRARASRNSTPRKIALEPCQSQSQDTMSGRPALLRLGELLDGSKNRVRLC